MTKILKLTSPPENPSMRIEDDRHLKGKGKFISDINFENETYAYFLRSIHAHAFIKSIDTSALNSLPGVLGVITRDDISKSGLGGIPALASPIGNDGRKAKVTPRSLLASDKVRFVGEEVAMVIANTLEEAKEAADLIIVNYETICSVSDAKSATDDKSPTLHSVAPKNLCLEWEHGNKETIAQTFKAADHVVELSLYNNRVAVTPMETRSAIGTFDKVSSTYSLFAGTQGVHLVRDALAEHVFKIPKNLIRVVTPDVGGAFGTKIWIYPEYALVMFAAKKYNRPVKWVAERSEGFQSDSQGRDRYSFAEMALDASGRILGLRVNNIANLGAYCSNFGAIVPTTGSSKALTGPYEISSVHVKTKVVYTNTTPTDAYRGAGRPEHSFLMERLMDSAANQLGIDRLTIRERNLISLDKIPYLTAMGATYDSGDFRKILNVAIQKSEWNSFESRHLESKKRGKHRGIGCALYVEPCGGRRDQLAKISFQNDCSITVDIGSQSAGQGHETLYASIVAQHLGLNIDQVKIVQGDTSRLNYGRGTSGSRSTSIGGSALMSATKIAVKKGIPFAAEILESHESDLVFTNGCYSVQGTDLSLTFFDMLTKSSTNNRLSAIISNLDSEALFNYDEETYPNGCHIVEIEFSKETGELNIINYTCVDDFGLLINPTLVEGQIHGGITQGLGQAMMEKVIYDASGQLLSGSFMDYAIPRATDLPNFTWSHEGVPCKTNPLGVKGCGEAGCMAAPAAFINAIIHALEVYSIDDIQMPVTAHSLWQAINKAKE